MRGRTGSGMLVVEALMLVLLSRGEDFTVGEGTWRRP